MNLTVIRDIKLPKIYESERAPCGPIKQTYKATPIIPNGNQVKTENGIAIGSGQIEETNPGGETSLRHFFYQEYRKG